MGHEKNSVSGRINATPTLELNIIVYIKQVPDISQSQEIRLDSENNNLVGDIGDLFEVIPKLIQGLSR